jgi:hypothetical protein
MAKNFYVSIRRGKRTGLLAGPFTTHDEALALVDKASSLARDVDPWADFDAFGTMSIENYDKPGVLNTRLGL